MVQVIVGGLQNGGSDDGDVSDGNSAILLEWIDICGGMGMKSAYDQLHS